MDFSSGRSTSTSVQPITITTLQQKSTLENNKGNELKNCAHQEENMHKTGFSAGWPVAACLLLVPSSHKVFLTNVHLKQTNINLENTQAWTQWGWHWPSGSRSLAMPSWFSAVEKACSRLMRACWRRILSMSTRSGRMLWIIALNATPSFQLLPKSLICSPYFLKSKNMLAWKIV